VPWRDAHGTLEGVAARALRGVPELGGKLGDWGVAVAEGALGETDPPKQE
jgi:hypothetical protein